MLNHQENIDKMSQGVLSWLQTKSVITAGIPGLAGSLSGIQTTLDEIRLLGVKQEAGNGTEILLKKENKTELINLTLDMIRRMQAFAVIEKNKALEENVDYSEYMLRKTSDMRLIIICQLIYKQADVMLTELAPYGLTPVNMNEMKLALEKFSASVPKERMESKRTTTNNYLLKNLFATLKTQWNTVDKLMELLHSSQPEFYYEYNKIRKVEKSIVIPFSLIILVKDAAKSNGLPNAEIVLKTDAKGNTENKRKKTAAKGGCRYKHLDEGIYTLKASKPGYKDITENFVIVKGETTSLHLTMEKL